MHKLVMIALISVLCPLMFWHRRHQDSLGQLWIYIRHSAIFLLAPLFLLALFYVGLFFFDPFLLKLFQSIDFPFYENFLKSGAWLGRQGHLWAVILCSYFVCVWLKKTQAAYLVFGSFISMFLTVAIAFVLKHIFYRARPDTGMGPFSFFNFGVSSGFDKNAHLAFPSGDVAVVAGACIFLFFNVKNVFARLILLTAPFLTALSRMSLNRHWPSDVIFSVGLGFIVALFVQGYLFQKAERIS